MDDPQKIIGLIVRKATWATTRMHRKATQSFRKNGATDLCVNTTFALFGHHEATWAPAVLSLFVIRMLAHLWEPPEERYRPYASKRKQRERWSRMASRVDTMFGPSSCVRNNKMVRAMSEVIRPASSSFCANFLKWWQQPSSRAGVRKRATRARRGCTTTRHRTVSRSKTNYSLISPDRTWDGYSDATQEDPFEDAKQFKRGTYFDAVQEVTTDDFADAKPLTNTNDGRIIGVIHGMPATTKTRPRGCYDSDSFWIAVDNCCSKCITNNLQDFVSPPRKVSVKVRGIGGDVQATLVGTVKWRVEDDDGVTHTWLIPDTYYNATSPYRLLSPQHRSQVVNDNVPRTRGTWCATYEDSVELFWDQRKFKRTIKLSTDSNIALMRSAPGYDKFGAFCHEIGKIEESPLHEEVFYGMPSATVISEDEQDSNCSDSDDDTHYYDTTGDSIDIDDPGRESERRHPDIPDEAFTPTLRTGVPTKIPEDEELQHESPQAEMLSWHYRLGHVSFAKIRQMAVRGDLPAYLSRVKNHPKCAACMFGKATRRAWRTKSPANRLNTPPATGPGAVVAVDQMISSTPGLIGQMRGFITRKRYMVSTVFVDHYSGLSFVYLQKSTSAAETVEAKRAFERYAKTHGVSIRHYHADNGIFAEAGFIKAVEADRQTISYCAVNAHHQNGRAEKKIRDLQELSRTQLLHAKQRWPEAITANLWPYAMRMACEISNFAPGIKDSVSPIELFSQVDVAPKVKHSHTFGSPVYVLRTKLQTAGKSVPKWEEKARIGIFLGFSPRHSRKVALVLSLETGHLSPQFHCKFDDFFETMRPSAGNKAPASQWQAKTGFVMSKDKASSGDTGDIASPRTGDIHAPADVGIIPPTEMRHHGEGNHQEGHHDPLVPDQGEEHVPSEDDEAPPEEEPPVPETENTRTRSGRESRPTQRWTESQEQQEEGLVSLHVSWEVFHDGGYDIQDDMDDPIAFVASKNPDMMYLDQALAEPDGDEFRKAMHSEVESHTELGHWKIRSRSEVPAGIKVLPSVWAMRRKRRIATGEAYKWKARLNLHGGKQEHGVNFWETYAPVISWVTIRLFLVLSGMNKWKTKQVDFVLAFPQADIECPMYMDIPRGFNFNGSSKTHCLELKKNLYGQKQAGRVWNEYLHEGLEARGFKQSKVDLCLYYRGNVALMIYTDDGIFCAPNLSDIEKAFKDLTRKHGDYPAFRMTDEGDLSDYLGVKIEQLPNGTIKLTQPHLIKQILADLGFNERTGSKATPAASTVKLHRDTYGKAFDEEWHYRSIIGKLNFVEKSTRLDLAYSVHQCARFSADPKDSHAKAVKRIGKYLHGTRDKGLILNPKDHSFNCWVDADFVGNWNRVTAEVDPSTAKSRTGYVITYAGCPIVWASKLQTEVALSTTEAEYNALSASLREVIHMMQIVDEAKQMDWDVFSGVPTVHCKVFEDNSGALEMARIPKMRPRTKHLCVRLHHFREHVRKGAISINKIPTQYQLGDMATKPQPEALFVSQRESLMQWESEFKTKEELALPANHLRECDISDQAQSLSGIQPDDAVRGEVDNQNPTEQEEPEEAQKGDTTSTDQWHSVRARKTSVNRRFVRWGRGTYAKSTDG